MTAPALDAGRFGIPEYESVGAGEPEPGTAVAAQAATADSWRPTAAAARCIVVGATLLLLALVAGRPQLAALAAPFAVAPLLTVARGSRGAIDVEVRLRTDTVTEGALVPVAARITSSVDLDAAVVGVALASATPVAAGARVRVVRVRAGAPTQAGLTLAAPRWGRFHVGPVRVTAAGPGLLSTAPVLTTRPARLRVLPRYTGLGGEESLPHATTNAGTHRSRLRGEGTVFAEVRPFVAGDRLRRIDWHVTARTGALHIDDAYTERVSEVVLVLDSGQEAGGRAAWHGVDGSLGAGVRAAAGVLAHHLARGDSVSILDVGDRVRHLSWVYGRARLVPTLDWLLDTGLGMPGREWGPAQVSRLVPSRALVVALTPLLDERVAALVATLRQRGQPLLVIDTLPAGWLAGAAADPDEDIARRIWRLEREALVARLTELGAPVVPWRGPASLAPVIREVTRTARRGPR